jgi:succinate dehydrogenase flavin-adding protein (antitoxin of CptAB toxin-antitoxin module)
MRELDAVLGRFLENEFGALAEPEKAAFAAFLDLSDPEIHAYLLGRSEPEDPHVNNVVAAIRRGAHSAP